MTLEQLRLLLLRHAVNIGDDTVAVTNEAQLADRVNLAIQWVIEDFVNAYSWSWRLKTGTAQVETTGIGTLPEDYGTFGAYGSVSIDALKHRLQRIQEQQLLELRTRDHGSTSRPNFYCEAGQVEEDPGIWQRTIVVHKLPSEPISVDLVYYFRPPLISLSTSGEFTTGDDADFLLIPAEYHAGVIYEGAASRLLFNLGDPRSLEVQQRYEQAKARAWTNDHSYQWPRKRPRFSARSGAYR